MNAIKTACNTAQPLVALIVSAIGLGGIIGGITYGPFTDKGLVGPGFIPLVSGILTAVAGFCVCIRALLSRPEQSPAIPSRAHGPGLPTHDARQRHSRDTDADETDAAGVDTFGRTTEERRLAVVWIFVVIGLAIALAHVVGLLLALTLMTGALVGVVERKPWWLMLICMLGTFLIGHLVFQTLLGVPMPRGWLGLF